MIRYLVRCLPMLVFLPIALAQNSPPGGPAMTTPRYRVHAEVEEKARLLQDNNQDTYRALADEIFKAPRGFEILAVAHGIGPTEIPPSIDYVIKDRLSWAEMQYRRGLGKGVTEQSIVNFTNLLVEKFGLPDYVRTSPRQVRFMRMFLMLHNPIFMGQGAVRPDIQVGESINEEMSPLQAVHVLLEVLGHKFFDADFQLTPEAWDREQASRATHTRATQTTGTDTKTTHQLVVSINPKQSEIRSALVRQVNSMNPAEALSLIDKALEVLGIEK